SCRYPVYLELRRDGCFSSLFCTSPPIRTCGCPILCAGFAQRVGFYDPTAIALFSSERGRRTTVTGLASCLPILRSLRSSLFSVVGFSLSFPSFRSVPAEIG